MSKKILLINPIKRLHPPFGLMYIAAALEKACFGVEIYEIKPEVILPLKRSLQKLKKKISGFNPAFIGITCMSAQAPLAKFLTGWIKENFSGLKITLGGAHPTFMPHRVLEWGADFIVLGEGEKTVVELARYITGERRDLHDLNGICYRDGEKIISRDTPTII
ncbi:MAG: cobalamin-dependent protein, partial [Omnitrophica bacterium]|nr:cobalamin-dependent protein [Candidatus Omnitrophota bacterium]